MKHSPGARHILNILHILNDGFYASLLLLLPFITKEFGLSLTQAGLLGTILNSMGLLCALPAGALATRIGSMRLLFTCMGLYASGYLLTAMAPLYVWLFPVFIIAGVGFALFHPVAFAIVTHLAPTGTRGRMMANFTAIGDIGKMVISSVLTFIIASIGWRSTTMMYGAAGFIALGFMLLWEQRRETGADTHIAPRKKISIRETFSSPRFSFAMLTSFLDTFSSTSLFVFLPFLLLSRGIDAALLGTFSAIFFFGNLIGKSLLGRFSDSYRSAHVVLTSEFLMAVCIVLLAQSSSIVVILGCSIIAGVFTKGTVPVIQNMVAEASEHHGHFEQSFAVNGFTNALALTISPLFLGFISDHYGIVAAFYSMAVIAAMASIPALMFDKTPQHWR